jgi:hypothetical protein
LQKLHVQPRLKVRGMSNLKPGDLVFIPSCVELIKYDLNEDYPSNYLLTKQPLRVLITRLADKNKNIGVHYDGTTWYVNETDVSKGE